MILSPSLVIALLAMLVALGVFLGFREAKAKQRKVAEVFLGRDPQTEQQFFEAHFLSEGIPFSVVAGVRRILEEHLGADLSKLSAADDFSKNLSFFWGYDSMADVEIVAALEKEFGIEISDQEGAGAKTVRDIVNLVWSKTRHAA
jgi:acyl carrier protein